MMSGVIVVPEPEAFPREVRGYVRRLRRDLDAAARLERDWAIHLNLEVYDPPTTSEAILPASIWRR